MRSYVEGNRVTIPKELSEFARKEGERRHDEDVAAGLKEGFTPKAMTVRENNARGAQGEAAFAYWLYGKWVTTKRAEVDVPPYQVKTTGLRNGRLTFRLWQDKHKDAPHALVIRESEVDYRIVGWIPGPDIEKVGVLDNPEIGAKAGPLYFVEQAALRTVFPEKPVEKKAEEKPQLTAEQIAAVMPLLATRIPVGDGPGCFLCKWIHQDLEKNGKLTDHPKGNMGGQFPEEGKFKHLKLEGFLV